MQEELKSDVLRVPLYKVEILEYGDWFKCTDEADDLEDALSLAKSLCSFLDTGNNIRIVCPDGRII